MLTSEPPQPASSGTALIIDDESAVAELVRTVLERCGWQVIVSLDRREACELLRAEPKKFSLVLSDIVMPFMPAHEFLAIARAANPQIRVVMMSGHPREYFIDIPFARSIPFLKKPFTPGQLLAVVGQVMDGVAVGGADEPRVVSTTY